MSPKRKPKTLPAPKPVPVPVQNPQLSLARETAAKRIRSLSSQTPPAASGGAQSAPASASASAASSAARASGSAAPSSHRHAVTRAHTSSSTVTMTQEAEPITHVLQWKPQGNQNEGAAAVVPASTPASESAHKVSKTDEQPTKKNKAEQSNVEPSSKMHSADETVAKDDKKDRVEQLVPAPEPARTKHTESDNKVSKVEGARTCQQPQPSGSVKQQEVKDQQQRFFTHLYADQKEPVYLERKANSLDGVRQNYIVQIIHRRVTLPNLDPMIGAIEREYGSYIWHTGVLDIRSGKVYHCADPASGAAPSENGRKARFMEQDFSTWSSNSVVFYEPHFADHFIAAPRTRQHELNALRVAGQFLNQPIDYNVLTNNCQHHAYRCLYADVNGVVGQHHHIVKIAEKVGKRLAQQMSENAASSIRHFANSVSNSFTSRSPAMLIFLILFVVIAVCLLIAFLWGKS